MIHELKAYPAMKDSGVEWLGEVPEHWDVQRLKRISRLNPSRADAANSLNGDTAVFLPMERVGADGRIDASEIRPVSELWTGFTYFQRSDVIVAKITPCFENGKGACLTRLPTKVGFGSTEFHVLRPSRVVEEAFLYRITTLSQFRRLGAEAMTGAAGQQRVPPSFIEQFQAGVPPLAEQAAIVRFFDHADRRIRRHIRAKQKLIKLLEEWKQAIINRAVTRGLDPNVRFKPSGVEWLGDVPGHWEVRRVKQVSQILRGKFTHRPRNDPSLYDGPYPFIQTGEVARAEKSIKGYRQTLNERGLAVSKMFPPGTLVMTIAANIGDVAVLDFEACFPDSVVGFIPRTNVERDYLYYVFRVMKPELLREAPVNTQGNLNVDRIGSRGIALPPVLEQQEIVREIEESTLGLNSTINRTQREISLLREYRTRLIADVVTGKLDVRGAAARLPEEAEKPESLEEADAPNDGKEVTADDLPTELAEAGTE